MSRYRRSLTEGATFFFTVNTYRRKKLLTHPEVRASLHEAIKHVRKQIPFTIDAWVLLPDHLHAIWTLPKDDSAYGKRWGMIKAQVSRCCAHVADDSARSASRIKRHERDFWQRRFWEHQIRDERDFERHVDYVHYNPVKHGLVTQVSQWPYSTFHRYINHGVYPQDWGGDPGEVVGDAGE
ncbi:MAG: transposase [Burkholderiales bacterium]